MECNASKYNPSDEGIKDILNKYKVIAIVGLSTDPSKASYRVAEYMKNHGYKIIPVNPTAEEILGEKCYPDLKSIPGKVDIVDIFRKIDAIPGIVNDSIDIGAKVVWMQLELCCEASAKKAQENGLSVVMNKCIKIEHSMM